MAKKTNLPEPTWKDQLHAYGMSDKSIENMTFKQGDHDFFIKMNDTFQDSLKTDIVDLLTENNDIVRKEIAEIIITQNERWGSVITEVMKGIDKVSNSVDKMKEEMTRIKLENDKVHEELKNGIRKLMFRNNYWMIFLRLAATGIVLYFLIKYAHNHWWSNNLLSFFQL